MKACFDTKQPEVRVTNYNDLVYIFLCLNEQIEEKIQYNFDSDDENNQRTIESYVYDYREIVCNDGDIDINDVKANPAKYYEWQPTEKTIKEQFEELKEVNAELIKCLSTLLK